MKAIRRAFVTVPDGQDIWFVAIGLESAKLAVDDVALGQVKDRAAFWVAWSMLAIFAIGWGITLTLEVTGGGFDPDTLTLNLAFTGSWSSGR